MISRPNKMLQYLIFYFRPKLLIHIPIHSERLFMNHAFYCKWCCKSLQHRVLNAQVSRASSLLFLNMGDHMFFSRHVLAGISKLHKMSAFCLCFIIVILVDEGSDRRVV